MIGYFFKLGIHTLSVKVEAQCAKQTITLVIVPSVLVVSLMYQTWSTCFPVLKEVRTLEMLFLETNHTTSIYSVIVSLIFFVNFNL